MGGGGVKMPKVGDVATFAANPMAGVTKSILTSGGSTKGFFGSGGSELETRQFPGVFGASPESARIAKNLESLLGTTTPAALAMPAAVGATAKSPYESALQGALMNPSFAPTTASEEALLGDIASMTQGSMAARGLGPATAASLASTLAPTLVNMRQQRISNLMQALGGEREAGQAERTQDITQRGQTLESLLGTRGQDIQSRASTIQQLLELAGLAMPQTISGQRERGPGMGYGLISGIAQGIPSALKTACWVAEVLYGEDDIKTHLARHYATNNDTMFLRAYKKYGKTWAKFMKKHTWLQPVVRPIWDYMAWKGALMMEVK